MPFRQTEETAPETPEAVTVPVSKVEEIAARVTEGLPAVARVLDSLAGPMEKSKMTEPASALRRGAEHARNLSSGVAETLTAGRSLFATLGAMLPKPRRPTKKVPSR